MIQTHIFSFFFVLLAGCSTEPSPLTSTYTPADCTHVLSVKPDVGKPETEDGISKKTPKTQTPNPEPTKINLNTASSNQLEALPGVGPALAERIITYRNKRKFKKISDIRRVRGIGSAKFKKMKAMISVK